MKTLIFSIFMAFSLVASAQIPQTALNCADDTEGIKANKLEDIDGISWINSNKKDQGPYQNGKRFTGILKQCGKKNGKVMSKTTYKNGLKDGLAYKYHKEGWLQWKKYYANGKGDGSQKYYHKPLNVSNNIKSISVTTNLQTSLSYELKDGKKQGILRCWHANGKKKHVEVYENGLKDGQQLYYDESENLIGKENWVQGKKHGLQSYYNETANVIKEETAENGIITEQKLLSNGSQYDGFKLIDELYLDGFYVRSKTFQGNVHYRTSIGAESKCQSIGDGWRVPTIEELVVVCQKNEEIFGIFAVNTLLWSSTMVEKNSINNWSLGISSICTNKVESHRVNDKCWTVCVRDFNP